MSLTAGSNTRGGLGPSLTVGLGRPANGPGANSFNGLDFAMGLFRLDAKWARVKMDSFDLGYSSPQFGVNLVPIQMVWFLNRP